MQIKYRYICVYLCDEFYLNIISLSSLEKDGDTLTTVSSIDKHLNAAPRPYGRTMSKSGSTKTKYDLVYNISRGTLIVS
jgi:hypothetical protein